ncbi:RidA family protein [Fusibacter sp. JL298sf-3]
MSNKNEAHYVPVLAHNGLIYTSGQLPIDPTTGVNVDGGVEEQTLQALQNLERVLKSAGSCKEAVIQCRLYTPNVSNWDCINRVYAAFFGKHRPVRTIVPTTTLYGGALIEIEAIAVEGGA